ncbi:hypothetical protein [Pedobacter sp. ISL-64]|uniref:hypothetical protein n=1 Tax=Pedobacter sp. ISL-64 TaxID=2819164 RepID=UPI001BEB5472|nr:hypothetical protein [Pedobacter sp. ISL-64]MBT2562643.1 hypothetical protein [Pedobacter sp. ISL-64]
MKKFFLLFFLVCASIFSFSQNVTVGIGAKPLMVSVAKNNIEGSPYFNQAYADCKIKTITQKELTVKALRYNIETQQLEYTENNNVYAIQASVQSFTAPDSLGNPHHFTKMKIDNAVGFYEVAVHGNIMLLKQYVVKKDVVEDWYTKKKITELVKHINYFTGKNGTIQKLTPSTKNIANALANKKEEVLAFIKNEQLEPKQDQDLVKIFEYYNSLN